jgi:hypothetical protein
MREVPFPWEELVAFVVVFGGERVVWGWAECGFQKWCATAWEWGCGGHLHACHCVVGGNEGVKLRRWKVRKDVINIPQEKECGQV